MMKKSSSTYEWNHLWSQTGSSRGSRRRKGAGLSPIKINCVVQRGVNDRHVVDLARRFRGTGHTVRFIEFMDVGTLNHWSPDQVFPAAEIIRAIDAEMPLEPLEPRYTGEVASRYGYRDGSGEIGVIASVTQPFCGGCTRARLTTQGQLVTCLFAAEGDGPPRTHAWRRERRRITRADFPGSGCDGEDRYSEERAGLSHPERQQQSRGRIEMYQVGG